MRKSIVVNLVLLNSLLALSGCSGCTAQKDDDEKKKKDEDPANTTTTPSTYYNRPHRSWPYGGYYYRPFSSNSAYGRSSYSGTTGRQSGTGSGVSRGGFGSSAHAAS